MAAHLPQRLQQLHGPVHQLTCACASGQEDGGEGFQENRGGAGDFNFDEETHADPGAGIYCMDFGLRGKVFVV